VKNVKNVKHVKHVKHVTFVVANAQQREVRSGGAHQKVPLKVVFLT